MVNPFPVAEVKIKLRFHVWPELSVTVAIAVQPDATEYCPLAVTVGMLVLVPVDAYQVVVSPLLPLKVSRPAIVPTPDTAPAFNTDEVPLKA